MDYIPILFLVVLVSGTIYKLLNVTQKMDSLSKLYKVKVVGAYKVTHNGVTVRGFVYEDKETGNLIERETYRKDTN